MKTTPIPAQVTTVEDKIAGNLSLTQLLLLLAPLFLAVFMFAVLPPKMYFSRYKLTLIVAFSAVFLALCIRVKERIVLTWLVLLLSYYFRPHLFVYDKNDLYLRQNETLSKQKNKNTAEGKKPAQLKKSKPDMEVTQLIQLEKTLNSRNTRLTVKFGRKRRLTLNRF
jgi:hypothetical protein